MSATTVRFKNSTSIGIWFAVARHEVACRNSCPAVPNRQFATLGWFRLLPGGERIINNPTGSQFIGHYAERDDGAIYAGPFALEVHPTDAWVKCECFPVGPPFVRAGFRQRDLDVSSTIDYI
jgi:hypothetical protein